MIGDAEHARRIREHFSDLIVAIREVRGVGLEVVLNDDFTIKRLAEITHSGIDPQKVAREFLIVRRPL